MTWIYVGVGVLCLIALQMLRNALAMVFPRYAVRLSAQPEPSRYSGFDLLETRITQLRALGFQGPAWIEPATVDSSVEPVYHATFRHAERHVIVWIGPSVEIAQPNQTLTYYTTLLEDGRFVVTQVSDPYFVAVDDPNTVAQTIAPADVADELKAHLSLVERQSVAPATNPSPRDEVIGFAERHMNAIRAGPLSRGWLRTSDGVARPSFRFAARILAQSLKRPKAKSENTANVPIPRLSFLSRRLESQQHSAPSSKTQWTLMIVSAVLFMAIGWPVFGATNTALLLAVIFFHEYGHWVAMKAFGYGNPHITLLPLLGGVTIGHENDPSATKRAWVALAGPLPGVILGWVLFANLDVLATWAGDSSVPLMLVVFLLFINYLNLLPIPPLDGHHVLQAVLPPSAVVLQILLIGVGAVGGVAVSWALGFWPLAVFAALQLFGIPRLWENAKRLSRWKRGVDGVSPDQMDREWVLHELEREEGASEDAAKRIGHANSLVSQLNFRPMGWRQRTLVCVVYGALMVAPVVAFLPIVIPVLLAVTESYESSPESDALFEQIDLAYETFEQDAQRMSVASLLESLVGDSVPEMPATQSAMDALATEMGGLPDDFESIYSIHDGGVLGLSAIREIRRVDPALFDSNVVQTMVWNEALGFWHDSYGEVRISRKVFSGWWVLGYEPDTEQYLFFDPNAAQDRPSVYAVGYSDTRAYASLGELLRVRWAVTEHERRTDELYSDFIERRERQFADLGVTELLKRVPQPSLLERWYTRNLDDDPAIDDADLQSLSAQVGRVVPNDLWLAWTDTSYMRLSPLSHPKDVRSARGANAEDIEVATRVLREAGIQGVTPASIEACWVISGYEIDDDEFYVYLYWCPNAPSSYRYIDVSEEAVFTSYTNLLRRFIASREL
ncbi:MAG: site-2 protease family protein [Pseudomonadota bacterium]